MKHLKHFIELFTLEDILPYEDVLIENKQYFLVSKELRELISKAKEDSVYQGILLGKIVNGQFQVSLNLLEKIEKYTSEKIIVGEKQAFLFSCKRDIFKSDEITDNTTKDLIIIKDEEERILGLGKKVKEKGKTMYTPVFDIGEYLRREKSKKTDDW